MSKKTNNKIILFISNVYFPTVGGISTYIHELERGLKRHGIASCVISFPSIANRIPRIFTKVIFPYFVIKVLTLTFYYRILSGREVILHSHSTNFCMLAAYFCKKIFRLRAIHTFHSPITKSCPILSRIVPKFDHIAYVSNFSQNLYRSFGVPACKKESIIPGGIVIPEISINKNKANPEYIIYAGRISEEKGIIELLKALEESKISCNLKIVGNPQTQGQMYYQKSVQEMIKGSEYLSAHVELSGLLKGKELDKAYEDSLFLVCPSICPESAPMSIAEAMSHNLPVIAFDTGGLSERINDGINGIIVPISDISALSEAIKKLYLDRDLLMKMALNAGKKAYEEFNSEKMTQQYISFYNAGDMTTPQRSKNTPGKIKVLFIPNFNSEYSLPLCKELAKRCNLNVCVWKHLTKEWGNEIKYKLIRGNGKFPDFTHTYSLIKNIFEINPDIIHFQGVYTWGNPVFWLTGIPIVTTIHDVVQHTGRKSKLFNFTSGIHARRSNKIIVHGKSLKELTVKKYGIESEKIEVIQHGLLDKFAKISIMKVEQENLFIFFGRVYKYKGIETFLKAAEIAGSIKPSIKFTIAGSGDLDEYSNLIRKTPNLQIINRFINDSEVSELMQKAKAVILPYHEASQTGVVTVAYSFGRTVIASAIGAIPEIVIDQKTGLLFPPKDYNALADKIIMLSENNAMLKKLESGASDFAKNELSWSKIADKTMSVYESIIKE